MSGEKSNINDSSTGEYELLLSRTTNSVNNWRVSSYSSQVLSISSVKLIDLIDINRICSKIKITITDLIISVTSVTGKYTQVEITSVLLTDYRNEFFTSDPVSNVSIGACVKESDVTILNSYDNGNKYIVISDFPETISSIYSIGGTGASNGGYANINSVTVNIYAMYEG